jgi:hypothetical protein
MVVEVETFTAEPPCAGCLKFMEYADLIKAKYGDKVEVIKHIGSCEEFSKYGLTAVPAIVFNKGEIKIMGKRECQPTRTYCFHVLEGCQILD